MAQPTDVNPTEGVLYIVSTPIGNLEDITLRALRVLKEVDLIAAEDTRHTRRLLAHYEIRTPITSYFEGNQIQKGEKLVARLKAGSQSHLYPMPGHRQYRIPAIGYWSNASKQISPSFRFPVLPLASRRLQLQGCRCTISSLKASSRRNRGGGGGNSQIYVRKNELSFSTNPHIGSLHFCKMS